MDKMMENPHAIEIRGLTRRFGHTEAVNGLNLTVAAGRCYGLFGRNGAGKTTTIKCLLGHLRPNRGSVRIFGLDPRKDEVAVKRHIGYVPETMGFYPWMTAQAMLNYAASFRPRQWNRALERSLLDRFGLDPKKKIQSMSKGMRAQLSLICAIAAEPDMLLLDEPTSGLDPIVRREFIETVIGAYQEGNPDKRTVFVSTHLIGEWEGLIDQFTILHEGREMLTLEADAARERYRRILLRFPGDPPPLAPGQGISRVTVSRQRTLDILTDGYSEEIIQHLRGLNPTEIIEVPLSLEEIFVATGAMPRLEERAS